MKELKQGVACVCLMLFLIPNSWAQTALLLKVKIGNKYYNNMSYLQAIATYEDILKEDFNMISVLPNLARSFRKIGDMQNAELIYGRLAKMDTTNLEYTLAYAQLLAISKKYAESAKYYERYNRLNPADTRSLNFAKSYETQTVFINNDERNQVELMNFNSSQSDFSPAYYKRGLVFVSNRSFHKIFRRTFEWDQSSFLDLYYISDTSDIKRVQPDTAQGKSKRRKISYNDDDTHYTSNDTRTMGVINYKYVDTSNLFVTAAVVVTPFSKKLNTKYHEGSVTFNKDQTKIIFTRNNYNKWRARRSVDGINKLKLYESKFNGLKNEWSSATPLPFNDNNYSVGHPAFGLGDTILYFASDMPGGKGGADLYKSSFRDGKWTTPENLGEPINTVGNEFFPYIDKEGVLYFASDGHPGLGGLDIFSTPLTNVKIENLGIPLNSNYDDFGITLDETTKSGYFSSNRRRGVNDDDIYKISLQKNNTFIIQVVDSITRKILSSSQISVKDLTQFNAITIKRKEDGTFDAKLWNEYLYAIDASAEGYFPKSTKVTADVKNSVITIPLAQMGCSISGVIVDKDTREPLEGVRMVIVNTTTLDTLYDYTLGIDGKYEFGGLVANQSYAIDVTKPGYFKKPAIQMNTNGDPCNTKVKELDNFVLEKIVVGKAIKIENIYFDLAKYNIRPDAAKELDKIVRLMTENPDIIIELSSHTDCRASYQYNMTLSDNRAKSSASYIVSKGIAVERITGKGYGETKLVNDCACEGKQVSRVCTEQEHQANRRTEFKVTGFLSDKNTQILNNGEGSTPSSVPLPE